MTVVSTRITWSSFLERGGVPIIRICGCTGSKVSLPLTGDTVRFLW